MLVSRVSFFIWVNGGVTWDNYIFLLSFCLWACCLRVDVGAGVWLGFTSVGSCLFRVV